MEVLKYVKYCLSLFEECTINGLGTLQFIEAPPERDSNNNLVKKKYYLIAFKSVPLSRPRLTNIIAGKEGCSTEAAIAAIDNYVEAIKGQLRQNKEAWLSEIGLLKKQGDDILLMSHKFLVKSFKNSQPGSVPPRKEDSNLINSSSDAITAAALAIPSIPVQQEPVIAQEPPVPTHRETAPVQNNYTEVSAVDLSKVNAPSISVEKETTLPSVVSSTNNTPSTTTKKDTTKPDAEPFIKKAERFVKKNIIYIGVFLGLAVATWLTTYFFKSDLNGGSNTTASNATNSSTPTSLNTNATEETTTNVQPGSLKDTPEGTSSATKDKNLVVLTVNKDNTNDADKKKAAAAQYDDKKQENSLEDARVVTDNKEIVPSVVLPNTNPVVDNKSAIPVIAGPQTTKTEAPATTVINPPATEAASKKEDESVKAVEGKIIEPQFPGGQKAIQQFLGKVDYPDKALEEGISGHVTVVFTIDENGKVRNPVITEGLGGGCNEAALRVINKMPTWIPATHNGQKIAHKKIVKITFTPSDDRRPNPLPR